MAMNARHYDEALRRYQSAWRGMSVVPSTISFVVWACLSIVTRSGWPRYVLSLALGKDASGEAQWLFIALMALHLHMLSPLVAWALGHRRLRRECMPGPPLTD